ncbi:MAG TPA: hypothetical protein VFC23_21580 [Thermoanaerobaculia bacterium]|nr:hypothetical protein [Thermoanaerobaculia bacterium]
MTQHKHLKQLVRAGFPGHFPGSVPAATGLRVLFAHAGILAPHTGQPLSEAMVFGLAGGIGEPWPTRPCRAASPCSGRRRTCWRVEPS